MNSNDRKLVYLVESKQLLAHALIHMPPPWMEIVGLAWPILVLYIVDVWVNQNYSPNMSPIQRPSFPLWFDGVDVQSLRIPLQTSYRSQIVPRKFLTHVFYLVSGNPSRLQSLKDPSESHDHQLWTPNMRHYTWKICTSPCFHINHKL